MGNTKNKDPVYMIACPRCYKNGTLTPLEGTSDDNINCKVHGNIPFLEVMKKDRP